MAVTFVNSAQAGGSSASVSVTHGFSIQANDIVVALLVGNNDGNTFSDNNSAGDEFTLEDQNDHPSTNPADTLHWAIFFRRMDGTEGSTFDFTKSVSEDWTILVLQFRGCIETGEPWDVSPASEWPHNNAASGTTATATGITINYDNSMAVAFAYIDSNNVSYSAFPGGGYTTRETYAAGSGVGRCCSCSTKSVNAGSQGDVTWTQGNNDWAALQFALREQAAASTRRIFIT